MLGQLEEKRGKFIEAKKNYETALRLCKNTNAADTESTIENLNRVTEIIEEK